MKRFSVVPLTLLALISVLVGKGQESAKTDESAISIKTIILPIYPPMARLAGEQGVVYTKYFISNDCQRSGLPTSGGTARLRDAVDQALAFGGIEFSPCDGKAFTRTKDGKDHSITLKFRFSLQGKPSNQWCSTRYVMQSPYDVEISTCPADLAALGLMKIPPKAGTRKSN